MTFTKSMIFTLNKFSVDLAHLSNESTMFFDCYSVPIPHPAQRLSKAPCRPIQRTREVLLLWPWKISAFHPTCCWLIHHYVEPHEGVQMSTMLNKTEFSFPEFPWGLDSNLKFAHVYILAYFKGTCANVPHAHCNGSVTWAETESRSKTLHQKKKNTFYVWGY